MTEITTHNAQTPTNEYSKIHEEIIFCAQSSRNYAFRMALALKRMRDEKLYSTANYTSFGDYTETELGIKERQAYNYISLAEKHSEEFLHLNAKLGVTKLLLLSEVEEDEKKNELAKVAEDQTVAELKKEIKKITEQKDSLSSEIDNEKRKAFAAEKETRATKQKYEQSLTQLKAAETEKARIEEELKKLKTAPPKKAIEKPVEKVVEKVIDPEQQKRIAQLEKELADKNDKITALNKKLEIEADTVLATFKIKFNDLQGLGAVITELLSKADGIKKEKCKKALSTLIKKFSEDWQI